MRANRAVYGETLARLADTDEKIVVVDADLMAVVGYGAFQERHGDRLFEVGIAEQNMVGVAAGLATCGLTAFTASFAVFTATRALDQVRNMVCYNNLNVKVIGTHAGIETGQDGGTHMSVEDVAVMRALPNMRVVAPSTPLMTEKLTEAIAAEYGPFYMRFGREKSAELYQEGEEFPIGSSKLLRPGRDVALIAYGHMVELALEAAGQLEKDGIDARVIDMYSLKPADEEAIKTAARETGAIVTCEDHSVIGGLGELVAGVTAACVPCIVRRFGVSDRFGRSGPWKDVYEWAGFTPEKIAQTAKEAISAKNAG